MKMRLTSLLVFLLAINVPLPAATRAVFDNPDVLRTPVNVGLVRTGDFNDDGNADVATTTFDHGTGHELLVFTGRGDGTFDLPRSTPLGDFSGWKVAHLNGDAFLDAVFLYEEAEQPKHVSILLGTGDGTFAAATSVSIGDCSSDALALGDVNGDGYIDVLACGLSVLRNNGDATFQAPIDNWLAVNEVFIGDANGDGVADAFLEGAQSAVAIGKGDGTFFPGVPLNVSQMAAAVGDLDGNGRTDVVYTDYQNADVAVRLATLNGSYPSRLSAGFMTLSWNGLLHIADLNNDGRDDIIGGVEGHVFTWIVNPDGTPGTGRHYVSPLPFHDLATADFDGDGNLDIVTSGTIAYAERGQGLAVIMGEGGGSLRAPRAHLVIRSADVKNALPAFSPSRLVDVTSDGYLDAITIAAGPYGAPTLAETSRIIVLPGLADGKLGAPIETSLPVDWNPYQNFTEAPLLADFNEDGSPDIFYRTDSGYAAWLGNGDGTFRNGAAIPDSIDFVSAVSGDFDGDGHQDIILADVWSDHLRWRPGKGDGTFDEIILIDKPADRYLVGDVNNDGIDDLVCGQFLLLGASNRHFTEVDYVETRDWEQPAALIDLNNDGKLDIVSANPGFGVNPLSIRLGNGDATFGSTRILMTTVADAATAQGDFNADGFTDLAFGTTVLLGDGQGSFGGYARFRYPSAWGRTVAGDVDGNGSSDLLIANPATGTVEVINTWTSDSRELPISVAFDLAPTTFSAGISPTVYVHATGVGNVIPTGAVTLSLDGRPVAFVGLEGDIALAWLYTDSPGPASLSAAFVGDDDYAPDVDSAVTVEVTKARTWSYSSTTPYEPAWTDSVSVHGFIESNVRVDPTGSVTVLVDGVVRGTGLARAYDVVIGSLAPGPRALTLQYAGDARHQPYEESWFLDVAKAIPHHTFILSPSGSASAGEPVTLTMTFADNSITGVVKFSATGMVLGSVPIVNGVATVTTTTLRVGAIAVWGVFQGNELYAEVFGSSDYSIIDVPLPTSASTFSVLTPCRIIDTRKPAAPLGGPALPAAGTRSIQVSGTCGVPAGAKAVAVNVTVVAPTQVGFLTLFPGASPRSGTSSINYRTGKTRANNAIVPLSTGGILNVYNSGPNAEHFLIDVNGYYK